MIYVQLIDEEANESGLLPFRVCFRGLDPSVMEGAKDFAWDEYNKWKAFEQVREQLRILSFGATKVTLILFMIAPKS